VALAHARDLATHRLRSTLRHLRHPVSDLAADLLGLGLDRPAGLLHRRVLESRLGVLNDLVVGLPTGPRSGHEAGREPGDEARSIQTHLFSPLKSLAALTARFPSVHARRPEQTDGRARDLR